MPKMCWLGLRSRQKTKIIWATTNFGHIPLQRSYLIKSVGLLIAADMWCAIPFAEKKSWGRVIFSHALVQKCIMWWCSRYSVFSAGAESITTKRFSFWNDNGNENKILKHPPRLWCQQRRCAVFDSTCLLFASSHKHFCGHSHFLLFFFFSS